MPGAPHDPALQPSLVGDQLTFGYRHGASDVFVEFLKSTDLSSWTTMNAGVDYTAAGASFVGGRAVFTLDLLVSSPADPRYFFRESFSTAAP